MTNQQATRRYYSVLIPAMIAFVAASFGVKMADNAALLPPAGLYAAALVTVALLLSAHWAQWRYMNEIDEFLRSIQIKAALAGLAVVMTTATGWGFLEFYAEAPALSVFWLNPLFWVAYSIAVVIFSSRDGGVS